MRRVLTEILQSASAAQGRGRSAHADLAPAEAQRPAHLPGDASSEARVGRCLGSGIRRRVRLLGLVGPEAGGAAVFPDDGPGDGDPICI